MSVENVFQIQPIFYLALIKKLKKNVKLDQTIKDELLVRKIKDICRNILPLSLLTEPCEWIVTTDASDIGWGATFFLKEKDKKSKICRYNSGTFNKAEQNYSSNEKEMLAVIKAIKTFELMANLNL